jgi:DnaK suppressor protein
MATAAGTRYSDLKQMLEQRRHAILDSVVQGVREASADASLARAGEVRDTGDEGEAMLQDAVRFSLISMKTGIAIRIDRALERLAEGSYGTCDDCGEDIVESRLRAMPFAERCRQCEELREDVERQRFWRPRPRVWRFRELVVAPTEPSFES